MSNIENAYNTLGTSVSLKQFDLEVRTAIDLIREAADGGSVIELHSAVKVLSRYAREWSRLADEAFAEWLQRDDTPKEIQTGEKRWFVGYPSKTTMAVRTADALNRLLEVTGGDCEATAACLSGSISAFKPGHIKKELGDSVHAELFNVEREPTVKEGKPNKKLICVDGRYLK